MKPWRVWFFTIGMDKIWEILLGFRKIFTKVKVAKKWFISSNNLCPWDLEHLDHLALMVKAKLLLGLRLVSTICLLIVQSISE
jgi:hypothetical protein